ncbi:MAG: acyltransferase [Bacteroidetes bacterium]|nr:acyltransferase [Bacteroidota bacterium]
MINNSSLRFFAHPSAIIDVGAQIGDGTKIWHFCHVSAKSKIGAHCTVGQNVFVDNNVVIGNGVKIQNNVSLYNGVFIEDDCFLGPSMVFTNIANPRAHINRKSEFKTTLLKKGCTVGANASIVCGVTLGLYAFVGAGAVVTRDVQDFALVIGNPARFSGWVSAFGERLQFDAKGNAICLASNEAYKLVNGTVIKLK